MSTAPTPPNPLATPTSKKPPGANNARWIVALIVGLILWFTNPSAVTHSKALGMDGFAGAVVGVAAYFSGGEIKYNNYLIFSTTSVKNSKGESKTASFGILGFVKVLIN